MELVELLLENGAPVTLRLHPNKASALLSAVDLCMEKQQFVDDNLGARLCSLLVKHGADLRACLKSL
jgi:hypothetical protein